MEEFAQALERMNVSLARIVVIRKELYAVTTEYEELRSSVEQRVSFDNKEMVFLVSGGVNVTQERGTKIAKAEQFLLEVQCVIRLGKVAEKLRVPVSALETATGPKVLKDGKMPKTSSEQKKANFEAEMEQAHVESYARSACVAELKASVTELEN